MLSPKAVKLVLAVVLFVGVATVLSATMNSGRTAPANPIIRKILRRYDKRKLPPTAAETALLRHQEQQKEEREERTLEDKIPKHVPIKIKIRAEKEKAFKDLKNANWHRDFVLEVTNTSNKPIYFLDLFFVMPEVVLDSGNPVGFPLRYGRIDFIHFNTLATPSDIPIQPGSTYVFTILEEDLRAWENHRAKERRPNPKKIELIFAQLAFGDGTGFNGTDAKEYPYKRTSSSACREGPLPNTQGGMRDSRPGFVASIKNLFEKKTGRASAGSFSALGSVFLMPVGADPQSGLCCPGQCYRARNSSYSCACQIARGTQSTSCSDPNGSCSVDIHLDRWCDDFGVNCPQSVIGPCEEPPPPPSPSPSSSPSPTVSPSPSPSPTCDPATKPNDHCTCVAGAGVTPYWYCFCPTGTHADYNNFSGTPGYAGCPPNKYNNGSDCCLCINTTCPDGSTPDEFTCECPAPSPGGGGDPGGGTDPNTNPATYRQDCVDYYWVHFVSYDGGQTWSYADNETYAGCYYVY